MVMAFERGDRCGGTSSEKMIGSVRLFSKSFETASKKSAERSPTIPNLFCKGLEWPAPKYRKASVMLKVLSNDQSDVGEASDIVIRGRYDQILSIGGVSAAIILARFEDALPAKRCQFDRKGRGDALSVDLYGFDSDQGVAIVQIRQAFRQRPTHFLSLRKTYALVGFTETGAPFRHPVSPMAVRMSIRANPDDPAAVVAAAQRWIWRCSVKQLRDSLEAGMRQGDVLLVRAHEPKEGIDVGTGFTVGGSHEIHADRVVQTPDGRVFAFNPTLRHSKSQHIPVFADADGWYSVRAGREEPAWSFSRRFGD
jgi:hypothetical protein